MWSVNHEMWRCHFYIRSFLRSPSLKYSLDSDSFATSLINCQFKFKAFAYRLSWLVVCFLFIHRSHHSFFHSHRNFYQTRDFCNINAMSCSLCLTFTNKVRVQKTHKHCTCRSDLEGGPDVKMLHCNKLCLKSISSHSESFWRKKNWVNNGGAPTLSHFSPILAILKNFTIVLTFLRGKKKFFLQKCPNIGLVS